MSSGTLEPVLCLLPNETREQHAGIEDCAGYDRLASGVLGGANEDDHPETIEYTAELVTRLCRIASPRPMGETGDIDVLVDDISGAEKLKVVAADWNNH